MRTGVEGEDEGNSIIVVVHCCIVLRKVRKGREGKEEEEDNSVTVVLHCCIIPR